jgi:hypothetical protein
MNEDVVVSLPLYVDRRSQDALQPSPGTRSPFRRQPPHFALINILRLALSIEGDPTRLEEWYRSTPIRELGALTAQQLVAQGDSTLVINFLWSIRRGERG